METGGRRSTEPTQQFPPPDRETLEKSQAQSIVACLCNYLAQNRKSLSLTPGKAPMEYSSVARPRLRGPDPGRELLWQ